MNRDLKKCWNEMNHSIVINKREMVLGLTVCTLAGVLLGMFLSPRKAVTIGSNNGGNVHDHRTVLPPQEPDASIDEEAVTE